MPELPEVESVRRQLGPRLEGRQLVEVWADEDMPRYDNPTAATGHRVRRLRRRGKYLIAELGRDRAVTAGDGAREKELIIHLGMTGVLRWRGEDGWDGDDYVRATFVLDDDSTLDFRDVRRFSTLVTTDAGDYARLPTLAALGPEPLSDAFSADHLFAEVSRSRQQIKPFLLSQRPVAGVGNIYADEALWRARISPLARRIGRERSDRLHAAIREVLAESIEREGTTFRDYQMVNGQSGRNAGFLTAYGQEGRPCPRCDTTMVKRVVGGRGTTSCPRCQR